jgi:hypothetical protein
VAREERKERRTHQKLEKGKAPPELGAGCAAQPRLLASYAPASTGVLMFRCAADAFMPFALKMHRKPPSEMMVAAAGGSASAAASSRGRSSMVGGLRTELRRRVVTRVVSSSSRSRGDPERASGV